MKMKLSSSVCNKYNRRTIDIILKNYNYLYAKYDIHIMKGEYGYVITHIKSNLVLSCWSIKEINGKMKNVKLSQKEIDLINKALISTPVLYNSAKDIINLSRKDLLFIVDYLAMLIGYDETTNDINTEGYEADVVIGKLMTLVYSQEGLCDINSRRIKEKKKRQ